MKKQIMSIAAIAAIFTTGAMAFDTDTSGQPRDANGKAATFTSSVVSTTAVKRDSDFKGDALIYPAYNQKGNFGTEITVRNNHAVGLIAKAVVYSAKDSKEVKDFNIYLSANDVARFTIKGNKITSTDDSIVVGETYSDNTVHNFASASTPFETTLDVNAGYVVVYGLGQTTIATHGGTAKGDIFEVYRAKLDAERINWDADGTNLTEGVYTGSPAVLVAPYVASAADMVDVNDSALSGQVRIFNDASGEERDVLLNATAIQNYTEPGNIMLWAPREYASMADRDMNATAKYDSVALNRDAAVYVKNGAYYTYNNAGSVPTIENKLLITQMYKRTLVQLDDTANQYWTKRPCSETKEATTDWSFQATTNGNLWDESENSLNPTPGSETPALFVSPATGAAAEVPSGYCNELAEIANPEATESDYANKNGYVKYQFTLPSIITQMSATSVGNEKRINWVNSVTN